MLDTWTFTVMGYPLELVLLLSCINSPSVLATQVSSQSYCELPIDWESIKLRAHDNIDSIQAEGHTVNLGDVHVRHVNFTCLAPRGFNKYISATVVTELVVTVFEGTKPKYVNQTQYHQFQMGCWKGVWGTSRDSSEFDLYAPEQLLQIPLETQCSDCSDSVKAFARPSYDADSNCDRKGFHYKITLISSIFVSFL